MKFYIVVAAVFTVAAAAQQYTTPVPILKQINRHNEDGSYSYGYEAADGTYKIETKYANGEVFGKYGYIDDRGQLREVEYGASRRGFEPAGNEIQVPPPTLQVDPNAIARPLAPNEEDDGQYREDPGAYYKNEPNYSESQPNYSDPPRSIYSQPRYDPPQQSFRPSYQPTPTYERRYEPPAFRPEPKYQPSFPEPSFPEPSFPEPSYQQPRYQQPSYQKPSYQQPRYQQPSYQPSYYNPPSPPAFPGYNQFQGNPAQNVDISSGSYSVNYR